jgi:hypothetical protein
MELSEERTVAIESIATLVHIKNTMVNMILKPAGVPVDIYRQILTLHDEVKIGRASCRERV